MKYLFFAVALFISPFYVAAQSNYHAGSVVTNSDQTLTGFINYREWEENPKFIEFKNNLDDKKAQSLDPSTTKSFIIDGFEKYYTYTGNISLNKTRFPDLADGHDTSTRYGSFFFKIITTGKLLTLYAYTDSLKTRYFIQEQKDQPFELIYHEYYEGSKENVHTDTRYLGQLIYLIQKHTPSNTQLLNKVNRLNYSDVQGIEAIVNGINGDSAEQIKTKNTTSNTRFYAGLGLNMSRTGFDGDNTFSSAGKASTYTPKISVGLDIFNNPNVQKFIFRVELAFTYINPEIKKQLPGFPDGYSQTYSFNQYSAMLTPQLIWNIYNKDAFKFYAGVGVNLNFSKYSKAVNRVETPTTSSTGTTYDLEPFWAGFPLQTGVVFQKRIEFFVSYASPTAYTKYNTFSISSQVYTAGVHFLFEKNRK